MKDPIATLNSNYSEGDFDTPQIRQKLLNEYIAQMRAYSQVSGALVVLSDLAEDKSYVFAGSFARTLGVCEEDFFIIDSKWETEIYNLIHPEDVFERHLLELEFFHFLQNKSPEERLLYFTQCNIRARAKDQNYIWISHESRYLHNSSQGTLWLDACIYNFCYEAIESNIIKGKIGNKQTGQWFYSDLGKIPHDLLSEREKEVLQKVDEGLLSKEIASTLAISINTVNRHRQNILSKLKVNNSIEAIKTAKTLHII